MTRQSISLTSPNDEWLKAQLNSQEYSSKSEIVNDLIRQARKRQDALDHLRAKLIQAENSGASEIVDSTAMLAEFKDRLPNNDSV